MRTAVRAGWIIAFDGRGHWSRWSSGVTVREHTPPPATPSQGQAIALALSLFNKNVPLTVK